MRAIGRNIVAATFAVTLVVSPAAFGADAKPEKTDVKIAVGGKSFMIYLPVSVENQIRTYWWCNPVWSKYWSEASISSIGNLIALITVPVPHRRPG
jgi:hypothetical protein